MTRQDGNCMTCTYAHIATKWATKQCCECRAEQKQKEDAIKKSATLAIGIADKPAVQE